MCSSPQGMISDLLIVDDEQSVLNALRRCLQRYPVKVHTVNSAELALDWLATSTPRMIISDQRMPGISGLEFLIQARELAPSTKRVILSAYADFGDIIHAFNDGTLHRFIPKPWDDEEIASLVDEFLTAAKSTIDTTKKDCFHGLWTQSELMFSLFEKIQRAACANVPVFIHGESGTGKELVARALHKESEYHEGGFYPVNCANFSEQLMESQLFGHKKGAFTGASSDAQGLFDQVGRGTLFLDETTVLPLALQAKMLRVLQEREYTPLGSHVVKSFEGQIITASHKSLSEAVACGEFREDLRYRLEVIALHIPPLRERQADIEPLLIRELQSISGARSWSLDNTAKDLLEGYSWPGNVRQLQNIAQYLAAMSDRDEIQTNDLPDEIISTTIAPVAPELLTAPLKKMTAEQLRELLRRCGDNRTALAKNLGVSRMTLWRNMKQHGLV